MPHAMGTKLWSNHPNSSHWYRPGSYDNMMITELRWWWYELSVAVVSMRLMMMMMMIYDHELGIYKWWINLQQAAHEVLWRQRSTTWPTYDGIIIIIIVNTIIIDQVIISTITVIIITTYIKSDIVAGGDKGIIAGLEADWEWISDQDDGDKKERI